ncbi:MAG: ABC transporter permease [Azospirillaceae bacterium]
MSDPAAVSLGEPKPAERDGAGNRGRFLALVPAMPPGLLILLLFLFPMALMVGISLRPNDNGMIGEGFTLANYGLFFSESFYLRSFALTLTMAATVGALVTILALPVSYFLARTKSRWKTLFILLSIAPELAGAVLRTYGWLVILERDGVINQFLMGLGIISEPLQLLYSFWGVVIGMTHVLLPFGILSLYTLFQGIDPNLERASAVLGANRLRTIRSVLLPLALPGIISSAFLAFTLSASAYATPALLGGSGFAVLATLIYDEMLYLLNWPMAAALANILFVVVVMIAFFGARVEGRVNAKLHG